MNTNTKPQELLSRWDAHKKRIEAVKAKAREWDLELKQRLREADFTDEEAIQKLAGLESRTRLAPAHLDELEAMGDLLSREIRECTEKLRCEVRADAKKVLDGCTRSAVAKLLPICGGDEEIAEDMASNLPEVCTAEELARVELTRSLSDVSGRLRELLTIKEKVSSEARRLGSMPSPSPKDA